MMKKNIYISTLIVTIISIACANSWELEININNYDESIPGDWISMGVSDSCSDGFHYGEDEYDLNSDIIDYSDIQFMNVDWLNQIDSNGVICENPEFFSDFKSFHEPSDLQIWKVTGTCAEAVQNGVNMAQLSWAVDSLSQDYEIYVYVNDNGINMRYQTSTVINCEDLTGDYELINGEWLYNTKIKILMGGCASTGLTTFYWDEDQDGLGSNTYAEYCSGFEPIGWVDNNNDLDDTIYCESNNFDDCWSCDGNNTLLDCNDVCSPETPVGQEQEENGLTYGAYLDECDVCSGGSTGHEPNSDQDCNSDCFGIAYIDDCGVCSGGGTEHEANSDQDCAGECFGDGFYDYCDECNGFNQSCLDIIFGNGPSDLYAQINNEEQSVTLTWIYNDINISNQISGYNVYQQNNDTTMNLITQIESTNILNTVIPNYENGIFCLTAYDIYNNETTPICAEASEFNNFNFNLTDGSNLISFPYLSNDDLTVETILSPIIEYVDGVIGEGIAAYYNPAIGWTGTIENFERRKGYWVKLDLEDAESTIILSVSGIETDPNTIYNLHDGANLVSYVGASPTSLSYAIPDEIEPFFEAVIGQGVAASPDPVLGWVGSLDSLRIGNGYWLKIDPDIDSIDLVWNSDHSQHQGQNSNTMIQKKDDNPILFNQSTLQSFYFIENITTSTFNLDHEDILISYCNESIVGARYYNGVFTDVPAMGYDGDKTINYCTTLDYPNFKILDSETGRLIDLYGQNIPYWENLGIFKINLSESMDINPGKTEIVSTFPNPFNPSTKINFNINKKQHVNVSAYSIDGKFIENLLDEDLAIGNHSIVWTPNNITSGVYIINLSTNSTKLTSKVAYIK